MGLEGGRLSGKICISKYRVNHIIKSVETYLTLEQFLILCIDFRHICRLF